MVDDGNNDIPVPVLQPRVQRARPLPLGFGRARRRCVEQGRDLLQRGHGRLVRVDDGHVEVRRRRPGLGEAGAGLPNVEVDGEWFLGWPLG